MPRQITVPERLRSGDKMLLDDTLVTVERVTGSPGAPSTKPRLMRVFCAERDGFIRVRKGSPIVILPRQAP